MSDVITYSLLFLVFGVIAWFAFHLRQSEKASPLDLITSPTSGKLSPSKIGQVVGVIVGTWVIVFLTSTGKLSFDIFTAYLVFLAGSEAYTKYIRSKQSLVEEEPDSIADESPTVAIKKMSKTSKPPKQTKTVVDVE